MNTKNPMDIALEAVPSHSVVAANAKAKTTVKITGTGVESGWGCVTGVGEGKATYHSKPNPDDWNMPDLQWYVKNRYSDKYGVTLSIPLLSGHNWVNTIKYAMYKKLGHEPKHSIVKDYFDFCFDRHVDEIIRSEGSFSLFKLTKPKYIMDYFEKRNLAAPPLTAARPVPVEVSQEVEALSIDDLTAAFRINSQYMVTNYGIVIPVNFLLAVKGKSLDEAVAYVQTAMTKLAAKGPQEMSAVIAATNKYQPYPKWLQFTDVQRIVKMNIAISDDNQVFAIFKELK